MSASAGMHDLEYLYASNTNVSNFVSVKLSTKNYHVWKSQMLCLLDSNNMGGIVDPTLISPRYFSTETVRQYDSLAKGWILGSVSEDILVDVYNLPSAKAVWEKLKSICNPAMSLQEDSTSKKRDPITETEDVDVTAEKNTIEIIVAKDTLHSENKNIIREATIKGDWLKVESILKKDGGLATEAINSDGSTILHIAVEIGRNDFVEKLFSYINKEQVLQQRATDGSTALHIAAIVGNKHAAELLVRNNRNLLRVKDHYGKEPLKKAYENMHLDTIGYLVKAVDEADKAELEFASDADHVDDECAARAVVTAISKKKYSLASYLVKKFPKSASKGDDVLMSIVQSFPSGLDYLETLVYPPSLKNILEMLGRTTLLTVLLFVFPAITILKIIKYNWCSLLCCLPISLVIYAIFSALCMLATAFSFICLLILVVCFIFLFLYSLLWKGAKMQDFSSIKKIENKIMEVEEAKSVIVQVCDEIDKLNYSDAYHPFYAQPIIVAACQNAYIVVDEILTRSPRAIQSKDKNGYDIIQLAIINRSDKIYNHIYDIDELKYLYETYKDSSQNNILHLAGRLAPSNVLNQKTGAALQLQRELQWCEEVKKHVSPTYITQENIFKETSHMVFTREHKDLLKEGEQWMKTTAESCSITAALITTIVFAAAITVPGGSNQEKGTPLFKKEAAFIIFAISDAISLFASSTALLVFLSILTARFAEKDFLVSLPQRLFIGLFSLLLSTTAMMVAFSATLFLVFCDGKLWMLAPICGLASIPIAFFAGLQIPLMVDLFNSTYLSIFGKERKVGLQSLIQNAYEYMIDMSFPTGNEYMI